MRRPADVRGRFGLYGMLVLLWCVSIAGCGKDDTAPTEKKMSAEESMFQSELTAWRMQRHESLTQPDGWTSLTGLHWLTLKAHYVGSSPRSGMRLMIGPPSLGMVQHEGGRVFFVPERGVPLTLDDQPLTGRVELKDDSAGAPSVVGFDEGKGKMTVILRNGKHALRIKHADAPTRTGFAGIDFWPADMGWRVKAKFVAHPPGTTIPIVSIIGSTENTPNPGALQFERAGKTYTVEALDQGDTTLQLIIADRTSGHESYGAGRYLDVARPDANGVVEIDFNRAYNPPCAFTPFATCPLPPNQNRLDLAITAGEKRYKNAH